MRNFGRLPIVWPLAKNGFSCTEKTTTVSRLYAIVAGASSIRSIAATQLK